MIVRPGDTAFIPVDEHLTTDDMDAILSAMYKEFPKGMNIQVVLVRGLRAPFIVRSDEVG